MFKNNKSVAFSSLYSNVWTQPVDMMFKDTLINSDTVRKEREAKNLLNTLEKQVQKIERIKNKEIKSKMVKYYLENFNVRISAQQEFFLDPTRLRETLIKKATMVQMNRNARRIQKWFKAYLRHKTLRAQLSRLAKSTRLIQKRWRYWKANVKDPEKRYALKDSKTFFIQKFLKGYQARRKIMYDVMEASCEKTHILFMKIDKV